MDGGGYWDGGGCVGGHGSGDDFDISGSRVAVITIGYFFFDVDSLNSLI